MKRAVILIGHGSKRAGADQSMLQLCRALADRRRDVFHTVAYLEIQKPDTTGAIDSVVHEGITEIIVVPYFLHVGRHVCEQIPALVDAARKKHPRVRIVQSNAIPFSEHMTAAVDELIGQACASLEMHLSADT